MKGARGRTSAPVCCKRTPSKHAFHNVADFAGTFDALMQNTAGR